MVEKINNIFIDDPLRIIRGVRQSICLDFKITSLTYNHMKKNVERISILSIERIRDEFNKILLNKNATLGIKMLIDVGVMKFIIPELLETINLKQNKFHQYDVFNHSLALIDYYHEHYEPDLTCLIACLLHDIGKIKTRTVDDDGSVHFYDHEFVGVDMVDTILRRLKYDNDTIKEVQFLVKHHMRTKNFGNSCEKIKPKHLNKLIYTCQNKDRFTKLCRVIESDNMSHHTDYCVHGQYDYFMKQLDNKFFGYKLPINGNDLMTCLNIEGGPIVKQILDKLLKQAFSNPEIGKETCLKMLPNLLKQVNNENKKK